MEKLKIQYQPIGIIHSPFTSIEGMPIQPGGAVGICGSVEVFPEFMTALQDLEGFSHIYLLYHFHQSKSWKPLVTPFLDNVKHGLFSTRAPSRPNPIGLSIVRLNHLEKKILAIENVDILDGTPLLDIKPYIPDFDHFQVESIGWLNAVSENSRKVRSDQRFK